MQSMQRPAHDACMGSLVVPTGLSDIQRPTTLRLQISRRMCRMPRPWNQKSNMASLFAFVCAANWCELTTNHCLHPLLCQVCAIFDVVCLYNFLHVSGAAFKLGLCWASWHPWVLEGACQGRLFQARPTHPIVMYYSMTRACHCLPSTCDVYITCRTYRCVFMLVVLVLTTPCLLWRSALVICVLCSNLIHCPGIAMHSCMPSLTNCWYSLVSERKKMVTCGGSQAVCGTVDAT
jgi:hypothetical protein